ncbi:hypothetical protein C0Q70_00116 [Pomacea canaliculata]|uniref:DUF4773 domain-containing protein n=1 Tax=Pomacea canaliculata TaxID=400727 RepID=A0A2T7PVS3_POMCA|nr:uncharacterized protein LOC112553361 [Pomacea canaliculata]PVD37522.1 hypothetical protein C0Q70_00116 [Pomacea canaliculata]
MSSLLLLLFVCLTTVSFSDADHSDVVIARLLEVQESSSEEEVAGPVVTARDLRKIQQLLDLLGEEATLVPIGCTCTLSSCSCCIDIKIKNFDAKVCGNLAYSLQPVGLIFSLTYNGNVIFKEAISISNPPSFCVGVPVAQVCIQLTNLAFKNLHISGCVTLQVDALGIKILNFNLVCFNFGSAGQTSLDFSQGVHLPANTSSAQELNADVDMAYQIEPEVQDNSGLKFRSRSQVKSMSRLIKMLLEPLSSDV